jgi:endo-1,4-beta-xylanase
MNIPLRFLATVTLFTPAFLPGAALPPPQVVPVAASNTVRNGPPIPTTDPVEPAHPAAIPLWANGAPGFEALKDVPEQISYRQEADIVFPIIFNINNPTITPFLPAKDKATGCAVIVAPGGGHMFHTIGREGYDLGQWLADHGIAAFVLKYRLARDIAVPPRATPYRINVEARDDAQRAVRVIRSRAAEWGINPEHIGFIGFSAGGEVAAELVSADNKGNPEATDPIEKVDARPDFVSFTYPGLPRAWRAADWTPPANFPPTFLLCASNDSAGVSEGLPTLYLALKRARVPVELVIFDMGGHGFGVRPWSLSVSMWPTIFVGWLGDRGFMTNAKPIAP